MDDTRSAGIKEPSMSICRFPDRFLIAIAVEAKLKVFHPLEPQVLPKCVFEYQTQTLVAMGSSRRFQCFKLIFANGVSAISRQRAGSDLPMDPPVSFAFYGSRECDYRIGPLR